MSSDAQSTPGSEGASNVSAENLLDQVVSATRPQSTQEADRLFIPQNLQSEFVPKLGSPKKVCIGFIGS